MLGRQHLVVVSSPERGGVSSLAFPAHVIGRPHQQLLQLQQYGDRRCFHGSASTCQPRTRCFDAQWCALQSPAVRFAGRVDDGSQPSLVEEHQFAFFVSFPSFLFFSVFEGRLLHYFVFYLEIIRFLLVRRTLWHGLTHPHTLTHTLTIQPTSQPKKKKKIFCPLLASLARCALLPELVLDCFY